MSAAVQAYYKRQILAEHYLQDNYAKRIENSKVREAIHQADLARDIRKVGEYSLTADELKLCWKSRNS